MKVSIIGSGRVGLSLGAVLADSAYSVFLTDKEDKKKELLGELSFYEDQLAEYLKKNQDNLEWTRWTEKNCLRRYYIFLLRFSRNKRRGFRFNRAF